MTEGKHPHFPIFFIMQEVRDYDGVWNKLKEDAARITAQATGLYNRYRPLIKYVESELRSMGLLEEGDHAGANLSLDFDNLVKLNAKLIEYHQSQIEPNIGQAKLLELIRLNPNRLKFQTQLNHLEYLQNLHIETIW